MHIPSIPETATETYLEKLEEKVHHQLEKARNKRVRERLEVLLSEVRERKRQLADMEPVDDDQQDADERESVQKDLLSALDSDRLNEEEQSLVKDRLKNILEDIKRQRSEGPAETLTRSFSPGQPDDKNSPQALLGTAHLSEEEFQQVKERMRGVLAEFSGDSEKRAAEHEAADDAESAEILDLGEEYELSQREGNSASPQNKGEELLLDEAFEVTPVHAQERDLESNQEILLDEEYEVEVSFPGQEGSQEYMTAGPQAEENEEDEEAFSAKEESELDSEKRTYSKAEEKNFQEFLKKHAEKPKGQDERSLKFHDACRRVSKGESLVLFEKIDLSEREQQMVWAFMEHLGQMKGLKRQQVFDMQHLTSRSIRELEQIFKTYHLQGYLRAELNNIYNRLLNLRSRFSILQH